MCAYINTVVIQKVEAVALVTGCAVVSLCSACKLPLL